MVKTWYYASKHRKTYTLLLGPLMFRYHDYWTLSCVRLNSSKFEVQGLTSIQSILMTIAYDMNDQQKKKKKIRSIDLVYIY